MLIHRNIIKIMMLNWMSEIEQLNGIVTEQQKTAYVLFFGALCLYPHKKLNRLEEHYEVFWMRIN